MKQFLLSFFLTSLSTSILVLLLSLLFRLFKTRISAKAKYFSWFLILLSFLFPFRPQFGSGMIRMQTGATVKTVTTSVATEVGEEVAQVTEKLVQPSLWDSFLSLPWFEILLVIWLLGCAFTLGKYTYSYIRFRKMLKRWGSVVKDEQILDQLQLVQQEMGIKSKVRLLHYPMSQSPMLFGFRDVMIVLPELDYTEEELQLIFKHELTHYKHRDVMVNLLMILVKSLHWFNPVAALACRETQEVGEMYCDYDVLNNQDQPYRVFYGETILTMIDHSKKTPIALTTCFYSEKFNLKRRIIGIMDSRLPKKFQSSSFLVVVSLLLLLASSVFAIENPVAQVQESQTKITTPEVQEISQEEALATVLKDLSLTEADLKDLQITREEDKYKILFSKGQTAYDVLVSAKDGQLLQSKQETIVEKTVTVEKEVSPPSSAPAASASTGQRGSTGSASTSPNTATNPAQSQSQSRSSQKTDSDDDHDDDDDDGD